MAILSRYNIMWLFVFFDLPTGNKEQRGRASSFRKYLLDNGFLMHQFSVYVKRCDSKEKVVSVVHNVKKKIPASGKVNIMWITDKQFCDSVEIWEGKQAFKPPQKQQNLLLF
jgi:CRISPR-associated protein Cas2